MFANVGTVDRVVRAIAGVVLISYAAVSHGLVRWIGLVGVVIPITTVVRFCPAYWMARIGSLGKVRTQSR
jgi:hypothetical protein